MVEKLENSGSRFPEDINQKNLDDLLKKAKDFWYGVMERSSFIEKSLEKASDLREGIEIKKEIKDILKDVDELVLLIKKINDQYKKMSVRVSENKQDVLARSYFKKLSKAQVGIADEIKSLINFVNKFRDIELNKIFNVKNNKERGERVLEFSNSDLDETRKEFVKNSEGPEIVFRIRAFEEMVMDSILNIRQGRSLQVLARLEALEKMDPNPFSDDKIFSYLDRIFRQLIAERDIPNAEKVLKEINKDRFYNLRMGSSFNYGLMLKNSKDDEILGVHFNN